MEKKDIRWIQRFNNYCQAFAQLTKFIEKKNLNELERQGLIQSFEYNFELSWNTIKDFYENQGETNIHGSRDAFRLAFQRGLIKNGDTWMNMIKSRALTTHTYNEATAKKIEEEILDHYFAEFCELKNALDALKERES